MGVRATLAPCWASTDLIYVGGKSAVLTAITVALGGKANLTGRGNGLKCFIREGQR